MATDIVSQMRRCTKCGVEYPRTSEFFHIHNGKKAPKDHLNSWCKSCRQKDKKQTLTRYAVQYASIEQGALKRCSRCQNTFPFTAEFFNRDRSSRYGLRTNCKSCDIERNRKYHTPSQPRVKDPIVKQSKQKLTNMTAAHRRQQRTDHLVKSFTTKEWERCLNYFNHCCAACGRQLTDLFGEHTAAADHWIPVELRGDTLATNIVPLCHSRKKGAKGCNNTKGGKDPNIWLEKRFGKHKAKEIAARIEKYFAWIREQSNKL